MLNGGKTSVVGARIENCGAGIYVDGADGAHIASSSFRNISGEDIWIQSGENVSITGCSFYGGDVEIEDNLNTVQNCRFHNTNLIIKGMDTKVINNVFDGKAGARHLTNWSGGTVIKNNFFKSGVDVRFEEFKNITVKGNEGLVTEQKGLSEDAVPIDSPGLQTVTISFPKTFDNAPETVNATLQNFDNDSAVAYVVQVSGMTANDFTLKAYVKTASATAGHDADVSWRALDNHAY